MTTIIYYSDSLLDKKIEEVCIRQLKKAAGDHPIISVTQKPLDLGTNICVGEIGRSWINLYKQLMIGCEAAKTKYVAMAESDCLYTAEFYNFVPPTDDTFYYNENVWFVQWGGNHPELNGMYSCYWDNRYALSQLICDRELLLKSLYARLDLLENHNDEVAKVSHGEPGLSRIRLAQNIAKQPRGHSLAPYLSEFLETEKLGVWRTVEPQLDIRGGWNFTGPKRGKKRTYNLEPWGEFKAIMVQ